VNDWNPLLPFFENVANPEEMILLNLPVKVPAKTSSSFAILTNKLKDWKNNLIPIEDATNQLSQLKAARDNVFPTARIVVKKEHPNHREIAEEEMSVVRKFFVSLDEIKKARGYNKHLTNFKMACITPPITTDGY
jgi:hypothetical protein